MSDSSILNGKVVYYTGCFANYYYPEVGAALVRVLERNSIEVVVPDQVCCGLPMIARGNIRGAYENIKRNRDILNQAVANGYIIVTTCSSCSLFLKREYPRMLGDSAKLISQNLYHVSEYLLKLHEIARLNINFQPISETIFYHTPCHLRAQEIGNSTAKMLQLIPGIVIRKISNECCGQAGTYGWEKAKYGLSKEIASKLLSELRENPVDRIVTDCGGCKLQIESSTQVGVDHPIILVNSAYAINDIGRNKK